MHLSALDPSTDLEVRLGLEPDPLESGRRVRWMFTVANRGPDLRRITFASAHRAEVVLRAGDVDRYRWGRDRMFAAVLSVRELSPGDEWSFSLDDILPVSPGRYSLRASVTARPVLPDIRGEVVVSAGR
ncbi:MAG: BsuPI-related putative proteinase inhibitor [Actinomycetes bacterium]|jgi:hypothetical protein